MKWLVDAQLPLRLCAWLGERGETAQHVSELPNGLFLTDDMLWLHAKVEGLVILSKDRDFFERALLSGPPPKVAHLTLGNCSNESLIGTLEELWPDIQRGFSLNSPLIVVRKDRVEIF